MATNPNDYLVPVQPDLKEDYFSGGLTKREHFAALAMQGLLADSLMNEDVRGLVNISVMAADALIIELNKEVKK